MLWAILNNSWKQNSMKQLYGYLPAISKTIQVRWTRHMRHCWRSKDKLISDVLWTPTHGRASVSQPERTYLHQLCVDTGCSLEDLLGAMDDRNRWRERESQGNLCCQYNLKHFILSCNVNILRDNVLMKYNIVLILSQIYSNTIKLRK